MSGNMPKGVEVAGLWRRLAAWFIDVLPTALLMGLVWFVRDHFSDTTGLVLTLVLALVQLGYGLLVWWMYASRGAGPGFKVMGLQLVGLADGKPIGWGRFFLRQLVFWAVAATGLGWVLLLVFLVIQERRMGWHDRAARSVAIQPVRRAAVAATPKPASMKAAPSTTVALPPHLVARAFDGSGTRDDAAPQAVDPAHAAAFGGAGVREQGSWAPPAAPGTAGQADSAGRPPLSRPEPAKVAPTPVPETVTRMRPVLAEEEDSFGTRLAARPGAVPQRPATGGWVLAFDDGRRVPVTGLVVVGRRPSGPPEGPEATLVAIGETGHAVSKTHLSVGMDARGVHVTDRGSTNGTAVVGAGGELVPCQPGVQTRLREGQVVSFGDRSFTVLRSS